MSLRRGSTAGRRFAFGHTSLPRLSETGVVAALLAGSLGVATWVHVTCPVLPYDDAFITYRYADNLARGVGLVYNEGHRTFGATSPLFVLLLAGLKAIFGSAAVPILAVRFSLVSYIASGAAVFLALRRFTDLTWLAGAGAALVMLDPWLLAWSTGGTESFLFCALLIFAALTTARGRPTAAGILTGLAVLTRPEGILLLPLGAFLLRNARRGLLVYLASTVVTVAPWLLFAQLYFGSVIPLSIVAKSQPLYPIPRGYSLWMLLVLLEKWVTVAPRAPDMVRSLLVLGPLWLVPLVAGAFGPYRRRRPWIPGMLLGGFSLLYAVGNPLVFEWYLPPLCVLGALSLWTSMPALVCGTASACRRLAGGTTMFVSLIVLASLFLGYRWTVGGAPSAIVLTDPARRRVEAYRTVAEMLNRAAGTDAAVTGPEIGSLGFYFRGRVVDACGLVSPEAHPFLPVPADQREGFADGAISTEFVRETGPEFVATMPKFATRSLGASDWFRANYDIVGRVPLPLPCWGSDEVLLFRAKAAAPPSSALPDRSP